MVTLTALWLPLLLSAVVVFLASWVMHMLLTYHKSDYKKLPDEEKVASALRSENLSPGTYMFPHCSSHKDMRSPEMMEKYKKGPVGYVVMYPSGPPSMGKYLSLWFTYCLLISLFAAYLAGRVLPSGTVYLSVFRVVGTVAFLGYSMGHFVDSIWKGQSWGATIKHMFDGLIYALLTAGMFGWLWPR